MGEALETGQLRATARYLDMMSEGPARGVGDTLISCGLLPVPIESAELRSFWWETTGGSVPRSGPACDFVRAVFRASHGSGARTVWTLVRQLGALAGEWSGPARDWVEDLGYRRGSGVAGDQLTRLATWVLRDAWGLELNHSRGEASRAAWMFAVHCADARWGGDYTEPQGMCLAFLAREKYVSQRDYSYGEGSELLGEYARAFMDALAVSVRDAEQLRGEA